MFNLFHPKTTKEIVLTRNGEYILDRYITRSLIKESISGTYELDFTLMVGVGDSEMYDLIAKGSIIKVDDEHGEEIFRIEAVNKDTKYIDVYCRQITIDECLSLWLEDVRVKERNGQSALQYLLENAKGKHELTVSSDIADVKTAYYIRKNLYEAIASEEMAFLRRWGGEIKRRGYNLYINSRIGEDKGFIVESRKNLTGFNIKEENTIITGIKPVGFDGITADIVYSENRELYPRDYIKEIKWEDVRLKSEEEPEGFETLAEAQKELTKLAKKEFEINKVDQIHAEYEVNFIELADTEEYKDLVSVQASSIGDDITVKIDTLGVDLKARCIERTYSPTLKRRITTTISTRINTTIPPKPSDILQQIQQQLPANKVPTLSDYIDSMITSGFKNSYYISRPNEALWLDNPDINKAKKVVRMNKNGLGFSQTGYYGKYTYGFTIDGKINADLITVGQLNGALIKAGTLTADKIEVGFKQEIKNDVEDLIKDSFGDEIKEEIKNDVTNIVLQDYVTKSEFTADKNGITNKIEGVRKEVTTKVTEIGEDTNNKIKEVNNSISKIDTKFSTANGKIEQQVKAQSETIQNVYNEVEGQEQQLLATNKILSETKSSLTTDIEGIKANVKEVSKTTGVISSELKTVNKDLSDKINSTLNTAKDYTNAEITTVNKKVATNESTLNVLKNEIKAKVSQKEVNDTVNTIITNNVDTNLIKNGGFEYDLEGWSVNESPFVDTKGSWFIFEGKRASIQASVPHSGIYQYFKTKVGQKYSVSFYARLSDESVGRAEVGIEGIHREVINTQGYKKYQFTFTATKERHSFTCFCMSSQTTIFAVDNIMVNEGEVAFKYVERMADLEEIKKVTTKINDVNSELKQTKDSITASINGLNSKTDTIQRDLNGKATTSEVSTIKQQTTKIEANLNGITQRVSANESTTKKINDNLVSANSRINTAEQKITPTAITSVVTSSKEYKDNITNTNKKIEDNTALIKQTDKKITMTVKSVSQGNLIKNGGFEYDLEGWNINESPYVDTKGSWFIFEGKRVSIQASKPFSGVYQYFKTKIGQKYSVSFYARLDEKSTGRAEVGVEGIHREIINTQGYKRYQFTFTATKESHIFNCYCMSSQMTIFVVDNIMVNEGDGVYLDYSEYRANYGEMASKIEQTDKNIKLEVSKKADSDKIVSTINQSAEEIKIKASKIQLEGTTTFGDNGKKVTIDKANYSVNENGIEKAFFGFKNFGTSYDVPKLYMSAQGLGSDENSWFTISSYKGDENPGEGAEPYIDLSYHCYKKNIFNDFSNIKMYNDGNIKIAPVNELKITTNYIGGKYDGMAEHTLAIFNSAKDELFNSNLQIGAIDNKTNTRGLILSDSQGSKSAAVRIQADDSGKFFRPCRTNDNIELGSSNYRWSKIFSKNSLDASSDIRLKENINYIKDKQTLKKWGMDCILEEKDLYNFVKDELNLTTYNFTDDKELQIGFLAQDIEGSKVGSKIITKDLEGEENYLSYNTGNYTNVLAGALKEAINKIEKLEQELQEIKSAIIK